MSDTCIFCKIARGELPVTKIFENETVVAFLDIAPISDGHTLVIPKQHFERIYDCPPRVLADVASHLGKISKAVYTAMGAEGCNVLCNNGRASGQVVDHLHFHIIPRNTDDGVFNRWPAYKYEAGKVEIIAEKICNNL
jgi:histidine triad (HIT) family protein